MIIIVTLVMVTAAFVAGYLVSSAVGSLSRRQTERCLLAAAGGDHGLAMRARERVWDPSPSLEQLLQALSEERDGQPS